MTVISGIHLSWKPVDDFAFDFLCEIKVQYDNTD